jgi:hypothetical protein
VTGDGDQGAATTVDPLTHEEQEALLGAAAVFERRKGPRPGEYSEFRASEVVAFIIGTGVHPEVLWMPAKHRLRVEESHGDLYVRWNRPKKTGVRAGCSVRLGTAGDPKIAWIPRFVARVIKLNRSRKYWYWFVRTIWETTGLPGKCSPRTLRHTSLANVAEATADPYAVATHGNVDLETGWNYVRGAGARRTASIPSVMPKVRSE